MSLSPSPFSKPNAIQTRPLILHGQERLDLGSVQPIYFPGDHTTQVGAYYQADESHISLIEQAAIESFQQFRHVKSSDRAEILSRLGALIEKNHAALSQLITEESGKPTTLAQQEVERAARLCHAYAAEIPRIASQGLEIEHRQIRLQQFPIGPVLAITPYNFPLNLVLHKLAPAIAAGCSITIKPAPQTPLTALYLGRLAIEAGYFAINVVPMTNENAERLVRSDAFTKLSFTGSAAVGWMLRSIAGTKSVTLELGGNAALIIEDLSGLSISDTAYRTAFGAFAHAGQICISVQRMFINQNLYSDFMASFITAARSMKVGDPFRYDTEIGPMISMDAVQRARTVIKDALRAGANVVYGGNTYNMFTMNPTILDRTTQDMTVNAEEVFAPIVTVTPYEHFTDALQLANQSKYGLHAGVYTSDPQKVDLAYQTLDVGGLIINDIPTYRCDALPYGGIKASGIGREGVMAGILEYSYPKALIQPA